MQGQSTISRENLLHHITNGLFDDDLERINRTLVERMRQVRKEKTFQAVLTLNVGDKVHLQNLSPQWINNLTGTVKEKLNTRVSVELDPISAKVYSSRRPLSGNTVRVPAQCVVKS